MDLYPSSLCQSLVSYGVVKSILNKSIKGVLDEIKSFFCPFQKDDLQKLEQTMSFISAVLPDAEQLAVSTVARVLVHEIKEVLYDIEDLLDLATTDELERKIGVQRAPNWFQEVISQRSRSSLASDLKFLLTKLDEIAARLKMYSSSSLEDHYPHSPPTLFNKTRAVTEKSIYYKPLVWREEAILGREEDEERLISCILSPSTNQRPNVIAVTGPGGIGKTTLVEQVCNDSRVSSGFDLVSWASYDDKLSYEDGLDKLHGRIRASARGHSFQKEGEEEGNLFNLLQGSKFLLVVDDIKHEILFEWKKLYLELLHLGSTGSTIILIAWSFIQIGRFTKTFKLQGMPEAASWSLFKRWAAFDEDAGQADSSLRDAGRYIVNKCGGSPLAVKTLACLLRNNRERHYWEHIHQTKLWGQCNEAWAAWCICLKLLPVELISCYATCSIAGEYHFWSGDELVWFLMAHGLLQTTNENDNLRDIGHRLCNELENFLPLHPSVYLGTPLPLLGHQFKECVLGEQIGHAKNHLFSKRKHLMWAGEDPLPNEFPKVYLNTPNKARTFSFRSSVNNPFLEGLISNLKYLRVLLFDHSGLVVLPESIGNLTLLRYLSLADNYGLKVLPESICKLVNLQTLDLSGCEQLKALPRNMHEMVSMRHFLLSGTLDSLPEKALNSWTSLHHLEIFYCQNLKSLEKGMQNLTALTTLQIHYCDSIASLPNSINSLARLEELSIVDCKNLNLTGWEGLLSSRSLKSLEIQGLPKLLVLPDGLQSASSMEHIAISYCVNLDLTGWNGLRLGSLKSLKIEGLPRVFELPHWLQTAADSLEYLVIRSCVNLDFSRWMGLLPLRSLKSLQIEGLPMLFQLPDVLLQSTANSLEHLLIRKCENLRALPEGLKHCTCLVEIIISGCPSLFSLPKGFHALQNLQVLRILDCPDLVQRCERGTGEDWHLTSHIPIIQLDHKVIRNRATSNVKEKPGAPGQKLFSKIMTASDLDHRLSLPSEFVGALPNFNGGHQVNFKVKDTGGNIWSFRCSKRMRGPYEKPVLSSGWLPFLRSKGNIKVGDEVSFYRIDDPEAHFAIEIKRKVTLFGMTLQHIDIDPTGLENPGPSSNDEPLRRRVLELEKELKGRGLLFLFKKGYEFEKEMLIQLWMALGIITDEPMEEIGANYFDKLVSEGYILGSVPNSLYKANTEKLNTESDILRQKQEYIILGNGSQNDYASTETLHVSVLSDEIDETIFKKLERFNRLKTLLFIGNYGSRLQRVPRDLFLHYESLVALDLSGTHIKELPCSTRKMIQLRYLDLSWTFIERLPERIDRFQALQTLKLKGCTHLCKLPKEMKKVIELRHLDLDVLRQLIAFPKGMGALVNLRTLSAFPVGTEGGHKISELKYLYNLTGEFCIAKLENVETAEEAKEASLIAKRNIRKLELRWSRYQFQGPKNEDEAILENLRPYSDLEEIQIICYYGTRLPSWIADVSFHKLVSLTLLKCKNVSMLPSLEKLPSLESLELDGFSSVTKMDWSGEVDHVAFPKLQKLAIDGMPNLETWTEAEQGDYPYLVELSIKDCPKLPELPSLLYLPSLENLEVSGCTKLAFVQEKQLSTSLQQLIVEECPLIIERCSKQGGQDWYKIQHVPTIWIDQVAIQPACEDDWEALTEEDDESADSLHNQMLIG